MVREHNEDNFLIADLTQNIRSVRPEVRTHTVGARGTLFAVCDGMGGAAAGEVASQMAVDTIHDLVQNGPSPLNRDQFAHRMQMAIGEAGARIYLAAKSNRAQRGMGTTSTVAGVFEKTLFLGQVGDSRAYMVRAGKIKQLTKDQSLVSKLIEAGQLTEAEAESYEHSHIILQALGTSDTVAVDLSYMELRQGDCVLLCSDGLSGLITSEQMREILTTTDDPMEACKKLTDAANAAGGHDNVTVIVARFDGDLPPLGAGDEVFAYQPYIISEQMEPAPAARASGKIKGADAPPPGKDVKYAVSMRPPPMSGAPAPMTPTAASVRPPPAAADDDDEISVPMNNTPRVALAVVLIVLALGVFVAAFMLMKH
jgi:protein phosphatase